MRCGPEITTTRKGETVGSAKIIRAPMSGAPGTQEIVAAWWMGELMGWLPDCCRGSIIALCRFLMAIARMRPFGDLVCNGIDRDAVSLSVPIKQRDLLLSHVLNE